MERLEDFEERIRGYLLEELSKESCPGDDESESSEEDHLSGSDHNTATDVDDTDADPNYSPSEEEPEDPDDRIKAKKFNSEKKVSTRNPIQSQKTNSADKVMNDVVRGNFVLPNQISNEMELDTHDDLDVIPPCDEEDCRESINFQFRNKPANNTHEVQESNTSSNNCENNVPEINNQDTVLNVESNGNYIVNNAERDTVLEVINEVVAGAGSDIQTNRNEFFGKDKIAQWKKVPFSRPNVRTRSVNLIRRLPGPINEVKEAKSPLKCFELMISDNIIENIVTNTNRYIDMKSANLTRVRDGKPTDETEIKSVIGLLILAGMMRSGHQNLEDLWGKDGFGVEVFYATMSLRRFTFLLQRMRFDNLFDRYARQQLDKFAPFREVFELFVDNCKKFFTVSSCTTIDEQLVAFRGRCSFRQFMKSKPAKYGLKIFTLTDARLFYVKNMEVYVGNQPDASPYKQSNTPKDVVLWLSSCISGSGRNITADNWFSSIPLVTELLQKNLTYVGTVRKDKRELPPELVEKKRVANDSIFAFQENVTLVSYAPKKNRSVVLVSTMQNDASIDEISGKKMKPEIITFYNSTKSGVDVIDEKCGTYSTSQRTVRWPLVLFYRLLDIGGINAQVIHTFNNAKEKTIRRNFLKKIGLSLTKPQITRRTSIESLPKELRVSVNKLAGNVQPQNQPIQPPNAKARCTMCPRQKDVKTKFRCETCKKPMCLGHMKNVYETCLTEQNDEDV